MADAEAKQIIFFDKEKKLRLNKVELERILNQEHVRGLPIAILSVIGGYRTGKSFLLSWLVRYFKADAKVYQYTFLLCINILLLYRTIYRTRNGLNNTKMRENFLNISNGEVAQRQKLKAFGLGPKSLLSMALLVKR